MSHPRGFVISSEDGVEMRRSYQELPNPDEAPSEASSSSSLWGRLCFQWTHLHWWYKVALIAVVVVLVIAVLVLCIAVPSKTLCFHSHAR